MLDNTIPVVFKDKEIDFKYFEYLHHFLAKENDDNGYTIIDFFGRAADVKMTKEKFDSMFVIITEQEFSDYADAIQSGEVELCDTYLINLSDKYDI